MIEDYHEMKEIDEDDMKDKSARCHVCKNLVIENKYLKSLYYYVDKGCLKNLCFTCNQVLKQVKMNFKKKDERNHKLREAFKE